MRETRESERLWKRILKITAPGVNYLQIMTCCTVHTLSRIHLTDVDYIVCRLLNGGKAENKIKNKTKRRVEIVIKKNLMVRPADCFTTFFPGAWRGRRFHCDALSDMRL